MPGIQGLCCCFVFTSTSTGQWDAADIAIGAKLPARCLTRHRFIEPAAPSAGREYLVPKLYRANAGPSADRVGGRSRNLATFYANHPLQFAGDCSR